MFTIMNSKPPTSNGTSVEQKIKAQKKAHALIDHVKNGSPKIKNLIREKCKLRIKEARNQRYSLARKLEEDDKEIISKVLREEVAEFEHDIELQDLIIKEILNDTENWFIEEFENELKEQQKYLVQINEDVIVFCPICEKSNLDKFEEILKCNCGIEFKYQKSLQEFMNEIQGIVQKHDGRCDSILNFYIEPSPITNTSGNLNCICIDCDFFNLF